MISAILANFSSAAAAQRDADASTTFEQETQYGIIYTGIVLSTTVQSKQQRRDRSKANLR